MVNGRRDLLPLRGPARDALAVALIAIGAVVALIVAYRALTVELLRFAVRHGAVEIR